MVSYRLPWSGTGSLGQVQAFWVSYRLAGSVTTMLGQLQAFWVSYRLVGSVTGLLGQVKQHMHMGQVQYIPGKYKTL